MQDSFFKMPHLNIAGCSLFTKLENSLVGSYESRNS